MKRTLFSRITLGLGLAVLLSLSVVAAACGDDDGDPAATGPEGTTGSGAGAGAGGVGDGDSGASLDEIEGQIVQVGELQPAPSGAPVSGWETEWSQLIGANLIAQLDSSGADFGRYPDAELIVGPYATEAVRMTTASPAAVEAIAATGVEITDADRNGLPDSASQIIAVYDYIVANGVPTPDGAVAYSPD